MKLDFVRKEVLDFLEKEVKPLYKTFDKAHNLSHYKFVTNNCVNYACALIKRGEKVSPFSCIPEGLKEIWKVFIVNLWIGIKMLFWSIILTGVVLVVEYIDNLIKSIEEA